MTIHFWAQEKDPYNWLVTNAANLESLLDGSLTLLHTHPPSGLGTGDMAAAVYDPDVDGIIAAAQLDPTMATDAEVAAAIAVHAALTTGVHGVGAGTIAKVADIAATKTDDLAALDDNTDNNATTGKHGFMMKYPNTGAGKYLGEGGTWSVPPGGSAAEGVIMVAASDATAEEQAAATASGGGVADGTDDDIQIQAAINACSGTRLQEVRLVGSFSISTAISMASYVRLRLDGKVTAANNTNVHLLTATSKTHFEIVGGLWDGNKAGQAAAAATNGFQLTSCSNAIIRDAIIYDPHVATVSGSNGLGITASACNNITIDNCEIYGCGQYAGLGGPPAIRFMGTGSSDNRVSNCKVHDSDGGVYFIQQDGETAVRNKVLDNLIYNIQRDGVSIYNKDTGGGVAITDADIISRNHLLNCGIDNAHPGIVIGNYDAGRWCIVDHNWISAPDNNGGSGINLLGTHILCDGNIIYDVYTHGIVVECDDSIIVNNIMDTNRLAGGYYGILIYGTNHTANRNIVSNNRVENYLNSGILIDGNCLDNQLKGNFILNVGNKYFHITAGSNYTVVEGNTVTTNNKTDAGTGTMWSRNIPLDTHTLF